MNFYRGRPLWILAFLFFLTFAPAAGVWSDGFFPQNSSRQKSLTRTHLEQSYGNLPLSFEPNQGQADDSVHFVCRGRGYSIYLTDAEAVLSLRSAQRKIASRWVKKHPENSSFNLLKMKLEGMNPKALFSGTGLQPGVSNYLIGPDPSRWRKGIPHYAGVEVKEAYPGVNLEYYGNQGRLEFDFRVKPGADPKAIRLSWEGAEASQVDPQGRLRLKVGAGEVVFQPPTVYQEKNGQRQRVEGRYDLSPDGKAGFEIEDYDTSKELVIDPVLNYGTYVGGVGGDSAEGIAVDSGGNVYLTGSAGAGFPTTPGVYQPGYSGVTEDVFISKLDPTGSTLLYSTYLGGDGYDLGAAIAVDGTGNAYVTGTAGADFPVTPGAYQTVFGGPGVPYSSDAFFSELDSTGSTLLYSTYLGGNNNEEANSISLAPAGAVYITGMTASSNFPTTAGAYRTSLSAQALSTSGSDGFLCEVVPAGAGAADLRYSTFLGIYVEAGTGAYTAVVTEANGDACVAGSTQDGSLTTTAGAYRPAFLAGYLLNLFVMSIDPGASGAADAVFSTYLGPGNAYLGLTLGPAGNIYLASTGNLNFPTTAGAYGTTFAPGGSFDNAVGVAELSADGSSLLYSTLVGQTGTYADYATGISVDSCGNIYVCGGTSNSNYPTTSDAFQSADSSGAFAGILSVLDPSLSGSSQLVFSTFLGNVGDSFVDGMAAGPSGSLYVAGYSFDGFPATAGAYQTAPTGTWDSFAAKIDITSICATTPTPTGSPTATPTPTATSTITSTPTPTPSPTVTGTPGPGYGFHISRNVFNPNSQSVSIYINSPEDLSGGKFSLRVYNSAGEFIKQLNKPGQGPPVQVSYFWDGTNAEGQKVADGVYILYAAEPSKVHEAKVIVLR